MSVTKPVLLGEDGTLRKVVFGLDEAPRFNRSFVFVICVAVPLLPPIFASKKAASELEPPVQRAILSAVADRPVDRPLPTLVLSLMDPGVYWDPRCSIGSVGAVPLVRGGALAARLLTLLSAQSPWNMALRTLSDSVWCLFTRTTPLAAAVLSSVGWLWLGQGSRNE